MEPNDAIGAALKTIAENMKGSRGNIGTIVTNALLSLTATMLLAIGAYMTSEVGKLAEHNRQLAELVSRVQVTTVKNSTRLDGLERTIYGDTSDHSDAEGLALEASFPWTEAGGPSVPWAADNEGG